MHKENNIEAIQKRALVFNDKTSPYTFIILLIEMSLYNIPYIYNKILLAIMEHTFWTHYLTI